ncbi:related to DUG2 - putative di- and tri-peptidase [Melanopsichium pennsylvanicum]|uniref:Zn-dependent exopeptidase n=2 Tax=Melanopsichium pennsylvanicum TaxID=63383 RepID=A0A077R2R3_9BASI|nr:zn-dependent exopeptidase [Melanopsichium pennsylvanicum 4]SNX84559.1 related to DUG2 - putative di- and tri-peptidase [Melanopsichium pennsylvanicum]
MCSPNVHFENFLSQPSSSRLPTAVSTPRSIPSPNTSFNPFARNATIPTKPSSVASTSALLSHSINHHSSVLSLAVDERRNLLYSGSQEGYINVWDLDTFTSTARLKGHSASVLALELAPEKNWLFSSSGDNTVRVWDTVRNVPLFVVYPAEDSVGDIFALKWSSVLETLYLGCQNTSIQWICLAGFDKQTASLHARAEGENARSGIQHALEGVGSSATTGADSPIISTPDAVTRRHKFFDSVPVALSRSGMGSAGTSTPTRIRPFASTTQSDVKDPAHKDPKSTATAGEQHLNGPLSTAGATEKVLHAASERLDHVAVPGFFCPGPSQQPEAGAVRTLLVPPTSSVSSAHFGYIYTLTLLTLENDSTHPTVLASGSGDESIKLWHATRSSGLSLLATLESPNADGNAVLALASWKTTLFSGLQGGEVEVWDLETCTLVRTIRAHSDDVICVETCAEQGLLFTAGADGKVNIWDRNFRNVGRLQAHDGIVLSLAKIRAVGSDGKEKEEEYGSEKAMVVQLVTGSSDNLIKIWDTLPAPVRETRRELERLSLFENATITSLSSTPTTANPIINTTAIASAVGLETATILSSTRTSDSTSAQWPLLRSLLRKFISFPSISSSEEHREDCRQAAHFLKSCFQELGAEARILPNPVGTNPLVLATFKANANRSRRSRTAARAGSGPDHRSRSTSTSTSASGSTNSSDSFLDRDDGVEDLRDEEESGGLSNSVMFDRLEERPFGEDEQDSAHTFGRGVRDKERCLFYGHYDCIAAEGQWVSDPFSLDGRDGYLYGRGVSDNKGPILAAACAVHHLLSTRRLHSDVVFLIEGEEENGSIGFVEAVRRYKSEIGPIDVVLLSNSYWLDEETPCLTIGLRGVVRATVSIGSGDRDVHSGVEGGSIREPMVDMVKLLARLTGEGEKVSLPGFYDSVRPTTDREVQSYEDIVRIKQSHQHANPPNHSHIHANSTDTDGGGGANETVQSLMAKWRNPSLSVHNVRVSGPGNSTVIPSTVSAQVSLRLVPDQDLPTIEAALVSYVCDTFNSLYAASSCGCGLNGRNKVSVWVDHRADWWLGSDSSRYFQLLREAVKQEWDAEPISIREGGSIPAIAILEKELGAGAVHLPMGQSSDNAHLPNERLRQRNLVKGSNVVRRFLQGLASNS